MITNLLLHPIIDRDLRRKVTFRSGGRCEICGIYEAVHIHHVTYKNAGQEQPADLRHVCLLCHIDQHPEKAERIARFEVRRHLKDWIARTKEARREVTPKTKRILSVREILAFLPDDSESTVARWLLMRAGEM